MIRFEYMVLDNDTIITEKKLNTHGKQGWDLISVTEFKLIFKRPLPYE